MQKFCPGSRNLPHDGQAADDDDRLASVTVETMPSRSGAYGLFTNLLRRHNSTTSHGQMSPVRIHHADRPVSCRRRTATARPGKRRARNHTTRRAGTRVRMKTTLPMKTKRVNHQYSGRVATPVNVAYFLKHVRTAVAKLKASLHLFSDSRRERISLTLYRPLETPKDRRCPISIKRAKRHRLKRLLGTSEVMGDAREGNVTVSGTLVELRDA